MDAQAPYIRGHGICTQLLWVLTDFTPSLDHLQHLLQWKYSVKFAISDGKLQFPFGELPGIVFPNIFSPLLVGTWRYRCSTVFNFQGQLKWVFFPLWHVLPLLVVPSPHLGLVTPCPIYVHGPSTKMMAFLQAQLQLHHPFKTCTENKRMAARWKGGVGWMGDRNSRCTIESLSATTAGGAPLPRRRELSSVPRGGLDGKEIQDRGEGRMHTADHNTIL